MATFDLSGTVNNILSSRRTTPQKTATEAPKPKSTARPGVFGAFGDVVEQGTQALQSATTVVGGFTQDLTNLPALQNMLGGQLDTSTPIVQRQFNPFSPVDAYGAQVMASKLIEIAEGAGADGLAVAVAATDSFGSLLSGVSGLLPGVLGNLATSVTAATTAIARDIVSTVGQDVLGRVGLTEHALMLFITHYPPAHQQISLNPFDVRYPNLVSRVGSKAWPDNENKLSFWREDALLNDHHGRWHAVNPQVGRNIQTGSTYQRASHPILGDRNGELFAYMHMQMIARYDAERLAVGLGRVEGWPSKEYYYKEPIPQGYKPGDRVGKTSPDGSFFLYRERPPDAVLNDLSAEPGKDPLDPNNDPLEKMEKNNKTLNAAAGRGFFLIPENDPDKPDPKKADPGQKKIAINIDNLGNTVQASIGSVDWPFKDDLNNHKGDNGRNYGDHHAAGHAHVAMFDDKQQTQNAMLDLYATSRDPMFWRWHKHVDNIIQRWRATLPPHDDLVDATPAKVRIKDVILCGELKLPTEVEEGVAGNAVFGYRQEKDGTKDNPWNSDFSEGSFSATVTITEDEKKPDGTTEQKTKTVPVTVTTTKVLWTEMKKRTIRPLEVGPEKKIKTKPGEKPPQQLPRETGPAVDETIDYLSHDDFSYFIRLENLSDETETVTVRIFLAPEELVQKDPRDNTGWIEMDRFLYQLEAHEHAVVCRPAKLSAVIRKPAIGPKELENPDLRKSGSDWCDCGWPYTLLLPRGTKAGMDFRLVVMLSGNDLQMDYTGEDGTSMSHCGLEKRKYPDTRPMGYPFDRPLPDPIDSIVDQHENWTSRKFQIRCR